MTQIYSKHNVVEDEDNSTAIASMVNDTAAVPDKYGDKYILGGELLANDKDFLTTNDGSAVLVPTKDATKAQGILRHDYIINKGPVPAAIIVSGTINMDLMDDKTKSLYTEDLIKALKVAMPKITIINRK